VVHLRLLQHPIRRNGLKPVATTCSEPTVLLFAFATFFQCQANFEHQPCETENLQISFYAAGANAMRMMYANLPLVANTRLLSKTIFPAILFVMDS
jgi:hypothetical protein